MLMHLKKCGSPSSASLEDSDEKPSPGSSNLQLRTSGPGFGRGPGDDQRPSHSGIQPGSSHEPMTNTDEAQAYLSAMSLSTPTNPLMLHSSKHQLTMMASTADDSDDNTVYQQYLPGRTVESRSLRVAPSSVDDFLILRQSWNSPACWVQGTSAGQTGPVPLSAISPLGADVGHPTWSRSEIAGVRLVMMTRASVLSFHGPRHMLQWFGANARQALGPSQNIIVRVWTRDHNSFSKVAQF